MGRKRKFTDKQEKEICRQYNENKLSTTILAKKWNCSDSVIRNIIIRNGYVLRTISGALKGRKAWNKNIPQSEKTKEKKLIIIKDLKEIENNLNNI